MNEATRLLVLRTAKAILAWNALGAFFFDFLKVRTSLACCTLTGFDLVFGRTLAHCPASALTPNLWTMLLLGLTVAVLLCTFLPHKYNAVLLIAALCAIVVLMLLQLEFVTQQPGMLLEMEFGYWLSLAVFVLIAAAGYLDRPKGKDGGVQINIISNFENNKSE